MKTDVFNRTWEPLVVRFNGSPDRFYKLNYTPEREIRVYKTEELDTDDYDNDDFFDPGINHCHSGFRFCRSFDLQVSKESDVVICFYNKLGADEEFSYKIEIREGGVYTTEGYVRVPLSKKIDFTYDDRRITCAKSANGSLWLCVRPKK